MIILWSGVITTWNGLKVHSIRKAENYRGRERASRHCPQLLSVLEFWLVLSCEGNHSSCELMSIMAISCLEDKISYNSCSFSISFVLSVSTSMMFLEPCLVRDGILIWLGGKKMNEKVGGGHVKFITICFICEPTENKWLSFSRNT